MAKGKNLSIPSIADGICHVFFAFDIGLMIDLDEAERRITMGSKGRPPVQKRRRAPRHFEIRPSPLRVSLAATPLEFGPYRTSETVEAIVFDFGAVSMNYKMPIQGSLGDMMSLSEKLYDNQEFARHARALLEQVVETIKPAVYKLGVDTDEEYYTVFQVKSFTSPVRASEVSEDMLAEFAKILRAERLNLSDQEIRDVLSSKVTYSENDLGLIDWDAAFLFDNDADDVLAVLEFANVALMELRFLDERLDTALDSFYEAVASKRKKRLSMFGSFRKELHKIASFQVDSAVLYEQITNALKLLGDQYLARVYRMASRRLHLAEWDAIISRKLETLESIYQRMQDSVSNYRLEILEWIIILLIAISILLPLVPGWPGAAH